MQVRWVVEAVNSRIKRWRYLDHILPNTQIPYIGDFVRIVCAITNKYFIDINQTKDCDEDIALAQKMLQLSTQTNSLEHFIEEHQLDRGTSKWEAIDEDNVCLPTLNESQLRALTLGTYQLKLSPCYIQEYIDSDYLITVHKDFCNILRVRLQSRHVSSKRYIVWIKFSATDIEAWYCRCRAGARTVGACAHVSSVLWFLGQSKPNTVYGVKDWGDFLQDATDIPETVDSSDSEMSTASDGCIEE